MRRLISWLSLLRAILFAAAGALTFTCASGSVAFAQRGIGHPGGVAHGSTPHVVGPLNFPRRPIYPIQSVFPIFGPREFRSWGVPPYSFRLRWGFNRVGWQNCFYWAWGYNCYPLPVYVYGEVDGGGGRELPQLYLKDGAIYNVTDYWLVNNRLHFTTIDESGAKWVEHTIDFDELDLQKTIDMSAQRGFHFVLRDEPMQQYLQDHPEIGEPDASPPASAQPQQP
jgi:hypothetical protein